jgi:hypothetical protein
MQWSDGYMRTSHPAVAPTWDRDYIAYYSPTSWSGWQAASVTGLSPPTVVWDPWDGYIHLFVRGTGNVIYHRYWLGWVYGGWSAWEKIPGTTTGSPQAAVDSNGNLHLAIVNSNGVLWSKQAPAPDGWPHLGGWTSWTLVASGAIGNFTLLSTADDRIDLIIRTTASKVMHRFWRSTSGWSSWKDLQAPTTNDPPAAEADMSINRLYVVIRGASDSAAWRRELDLTNAAQNTAWGSWVKISGGPTILSTPTLLAGNGRLDLLVRGAGNSVWHWAAGIWTDVTGSHPTPDRPLAVYRETPGSSSSLLIELIVRGSDSKLYHRAFDAETGIWTGWTAIPGSPVSQISDSAAGSVQWWPLTDEIFLTCRAGTSGQEVYFGELLFWVEATP